MQNEDTAVARYCSTPLTAADIDHEAWRTAPVVRITRYWSGTVAPESRHAALQVIWTPASLVLRFDCRQEEPLVVAGDPQTKAKTRGLWDRDVAELFVTPRMMPLDEYLEFEAAPTGEWIDLALKTTASGRVTDWDFRSGMTAAARIEPERVLLTMSIPWSEKLPQPQAGEEWRVNFCRCVGTEPDRGYLSWQPTHTATPNFHVPEVFGRLRFE